jgi:hypothetical protein
MSRKLNPKSNLKQSTLDNFVFIQPTAPQPTAASQVDPFLSPDPNAGRGDEFPVIPSLSPLRAISASIEPGDRTLLARKAAQAATAELERRGLPGQRSFLNFMEPIRPPILGSISPDAQREIEAADAAAAANQAAADAANQAAAIAANQAADARDARAVARAQKEQYRLGPEVSTQVGAIYSPSPTRSQGGSGRMNKMNFLTFRGRHKSKKSKRKSKKNKMQKKKTRRNRRLVK